MVLGRIAFVVLVLLVPAGAFGQERGDKPKRWVRFLPVGEAPPYRYEYRNGVRHELPPEPGSAPPREVLLRSGEEDVGSVFLALGSISEPLAIPQGGAQIPILKKGDGEGAKAWHLLQPPDSGHLLTLLWRDPREKSWDKARRLVLQDDPGVFGAGRLRIINVSPFPTKVRLAGKEFEVAPGKHEIRAGGDPDGVELRVSVGDGQGNWMTVFSSGLVQNRGERVNVVVFRADGEKPRRPAKVLIDRELARLPPVPKGNEKAERPEIR